MQTIQLRPGYHKPDISPGSDAQFMPSKGKRTGNIDIKGQGRSYRVQGGDYGTSRIQMFGPAVVSEVNGVRIDVRSTPPQDGIDFGGNHHMCVVRKSRIVGIHGRQNTVHGDAVQVYNNSDVDVLLIEDCTLASAYQCIMTTGGVRFIILRRVNLRDEPTLREQQSVAVLHMAAPKSPPCSIFLEDVWVDWPNASKSWLAISGPTKIIGHPIFGVPPSGDFCP